MTNRTQRQLQKIQKHGIQYNGFDLEGNTRKEKRFFRFEDHVYHALLNNPVAAEEVIGLTEAALNQNNKQKTELLQILLKKIFAKDALHTSAQAEFELYYESEIFRKLSHETFAQYAYTHFLPQIATGERVGYVGYIIDTIVKYLQVPDHQVWGSLIKPATNQPERFLKEDLINDSKDIDINMIKHFMERNIYLHAQDESDDNDDHTTERIEIEFYLYLLSNTRYFTFDLQKAIDSFTREKYDTMMETHSIPADMYIYIGDNWKSAYRERSIL